jgi:cob(I)alamin adenosyltransferase
MSITTKTGDAGETDLIGRRLPKDHLLFECLGTLDELNCFLGAAKAALKNRPDTAKIIEDIQKELFTLSGILAGAAIPVPDDRKLCACITELESKQKPFRSFALPGANTPSALLHIARTVCRRCERLLVSLNKSGEAPEGILVYINRLSDLLFLLAQGES